MVPGKSFRLRDCLGTARRRKWLVAAPFAIVNVATAVVAPGLTPTRSVVYLSGLAGSVVAAFAFAVVLHLRDRTFRTDDDVASALDLPVLAAVPAMMTASERHHHRRRRLMRSLAATTLAVAGVVAYIWAASR